MDYSGTDELRILTVAKNYNRFLMNRVIEFLVGKKCLDFGAGIGTFSESVLKSTNVDLLCFEIDPSQVEEIKKKNLKVVSSYDGISDSEINYIFTLNVLEHIEEDTRELLKLKEKLNSDGRIYCYVPACPVLYGKFDKKVGHFRRYTRRELILKFNEAGFDVISCRYQDFLGFFAALVFKLFMDSETINLKSVIVYDRLIFPVSRLFDYLTMGKVIGKNLEVVARPR